MTSAQIITALQCCLNSDEYGRRDCCKCSSECGIFESEECCTTTLLNSVINLISRQNAEIEMWKDIAIRETEYVEIARVEAINEFAERLKETLRLEEDCDYDCENCCYECKEYIPEIDSLVKEMTEDENNA